MAGEEEAEDWTADALKEYMDSKIQDFHDDLGGIEEDIAHLEGRLSVLETQQAAKTGSHASLLALSSFTIAAVGALTGLGVLIFYLLHG